MEPVVLEAVVLEAVVLVAVAWLSGFLSGTIGFASGVLPAAALSLVLPPAEAVPLLAPLVLASAALGLAFHWKRWERPYVFILLPPILVGTWAGTAFLSEAPASLVSRVVAVFVTVVALQELGRRFTGGGEPSWLQRAVGSVPGGLLLGLVSGVASAVAHAGGVVAAAYLMCAGLRRGPFTSTVLLILLLADAAKLIMFWDAGLLTMEMAGPLAWAMPFLLLGAYSGRRVWHHLSPIQFRTAVAATLLGVGLFLLVKA